MKLLYFTFLLSYHYVYAGSNISIPTDTEADLLQSQIKASKATRKQFVSDKLFLHSKNLARKHAELARARDTFFSLLPQYDTLTSEKDSRYKALDTAEYDTRLIELYKLQDFDIRQKLSLKTKEYLIRKNLDSIMKQPELLIPDCTVKQQKSEMHSELLNKIKKISMAVGDMDYLHAPRLTLAEVVMGFSEHEDYELIGKGLNELVVCWCRGVDSGRQITATTAQNNLELVRKNDIYLEPLYKYGIKYSNDRSRLIFHYAFSPIRYGRPHFNRNIIVKLLAPVGNKDVYQLPTTVKELVHQYDGTQPLWPVIFSSREEALFMQRSFIAESHLYQYKGDLCGKTSFGSLPFNVISQTQESAIKKKLANFLRNSLPDITESELKIAMILPEITRLVIKSFFGELPITNKVLKTIRSLSELQKNIILQFPDLFRNIDLSKCREMLQIVESIPEEERQDIINMPGLLQVQDGFEEQKHLLKTILLIPIEERLQNIQNIRNLFFNVARYQSYEFYNNYYEILQKIPEEDRCELLKVEGLLSIEDQACDDRAAMLDATYLIPAKERAKAVDLLRTIFQENIPYSMAYSICRAIETIASAERLNILRLVNISDFNDYGNIPYVIQIFALLPLKKLRENESLIQKLSKTSWPYDHDFLVDAVKKIEQPNRIKVLSIPGLITDKRNSDDIAYVIYILALFLPEHREQALPFALGALQLDEDYIRVENDERSTLLFECIKKIKLQNRIDICSYDFTDSCYLEYYVKIWVNNYSRAEKEIYDPLAESNFFM